MKKTYINPSIEVIRLKMQQHLLESSPTMTIGGETTVVEAPENNDIEW